MRPLFLPCYCGSLRQAARVLTQHYDECLKPAGLRITQYTLLETIHRLPGILVSELGQALAMDDTTVTHSLNVMKTAGWVGSVRSQTDRRQRALQITEKGLRLLECARPLWEEAQSQVEARLSAQAIAINQRAAFDLAQAFA